jgi:glycosyltransferase involved in cell wall biosynthesis
VNASVVIPVLNDRERLRRTLTAIGAQTARSRLEVIVVDNGSSDGSRGVADELADITLQVTGGNGSSAARNLGLERARHSLLVTTDADCVPCDRGWAGALIEAISDTPDDVLASTGPLLPLPQPDRWAVRADITPHSASRPDGSPAYAINGSACYRTELLLSIGGYPDYGANDAAVGRVATRHGLRFVWAPTASVFHENGVGLRSYLSQRFKYGVYAAEIQRPTRSVVTYAPGVARQLAGGLKPLRRLDLHETTAQVAGAVATHAGALSVTHRGERPRPL